MSRMSRWATPRRGRRNPRRGVRLLVVGLGVLYAERGEQVGATHDQLPPEPKRGDWQLSCRKRPVGRAATDPERPWHYRVERECDRQGPQARRCHATVIRPGRRDRRARRRWTLSLGTDVKTGRIGHRNTPGPPGWWNRTTSSCWTSHWGSPCPMASRTFFFWKNEPCGMSRPSR